MERMIGRPTDWADRTPNEIAAYDLLDSLGVRYERIDHAPAMTMEDCREADLALDAQICKNLVLTNRQHTVFYLLMIPGDKRFKTSDLSRQLGVSRLSFAGAEHLKELLDVTPGSVSVLCLRADADNRVQLLVDKDVTQGQYIGCHPCINTTSLRIAQKDLWEVILPALHHDVITVDLPDNTMEEEKKND